MWISRYPDAAIQSGRSCAHRGLREAARSELMAEICAHHVFVLTTDQPPLAKTFEAEWRQIDGARAPFEDKLRHRSAHRRSGLESGAAEAGGNVQSARAGYRAQHGARVGAHVVDPGVAPRV